LYTSHFPSSLNGFDAVFLSYGNYGQILAEGEIITMEMTDAISEYLYQGGRIYAESGPFFGMMEYFEYPNLEEIMELFGVEEFETPLTTNNIDMLNGLPGSVCQDLVFAESSQNPNWYIDIMTPNDNGIAAFEEDGYGIVAVQGEGEYGQKTFCFSYALAHLEDGSQGTREELMTRIMDWFMIGLGEKEPLLNNKYLTINNYPNPFTTTTTFSYILSMPATCIIHIFNSHGQQVDEIQQEQTKGEQQLKWNADGFPAGMYYFRIQAGEQVSSGKLVLMK
jgi:hypothetical protein